MLIDTAELREIQRIAKARKMTVAEWVRTTLRAARHSEPTATPERKLAAVRAASRHEFLAGDIDQMLAEIERPARSSTTTAPTSSPSGG